MDNPEPGFREIHVNYVLDDKTLNQSTRLSLKVFDRLPWLANGLGGLFVLMGCWSLGLSLVQGNLAVTMQAAPFMLPLAAVGLALLFRNRLICWLMLKKLRKSSIYGQQVRISFGEDAYTIFQTAGSAKTLYSALDKTVTNRDAILLYVNASVFHFAPREGFAEADGFERLAALLVEKTANRRL